MSITSAHGKNTIICAHTTIFCAHILITKAAVLHGCRPTAALQIPIAWLLFCLSSLCLSIFLTGCSVRFLANFHTAALKRAEQHREKSLCISGRQGLKTARPHKTGINFFKLNKSTILQNQKAEMGTVIARLLNPSRELFL